MCRPDGALFFRQKWFHRSHFTSFRANAVGCVLSSLTTLESGWMFRFRGCSAPCNGGRNTSYFLLVLLANTLSANLSCLPGRLWYSHCVAFVIPDGTRATAPAHPALRRAPSPIARRFVCAF